MRTGQVSAAGGGAVGVMSVQAVAAGAGLSNIVFSLRGSSSTPISSEI